MSCTIFISALIFVFFKVLIASTASSISATAPRKTGRCYGRMAERSPARTQSPGHWEIAGLVLDQAFPTFPNGFPADVIAEFERRIGRGILAKSSRQAGDHRGAW